jgi:hypothetical protein
MAFKKTRELLDKITKTLKLMYRKTPLLVPGLDQFSNSNSFILNQLVAKTQTYLKTST